MVFKHLLFVTFFLFSIFNLGEAQFEIVSVQRRLTDQQMIQEGRDLSQGNYITGIKNIGDKFILVFSQDSSPLRHNFIIRLRFFVILTLNLDFRFLNSSSNTWTPSILPFLFY